MGSYPYVTTSPLILVGDFNYMLAPSEKLGHVPHPEWLFHGFREVTSDRNLHDLDLQGYPFTWQRSKGTDIAVKHRIDRAMVLDSRMSLFPSAWRI